MAKQRSGRNPLVLDGGALSIQDVVDVARDGRSVRLSPAAVAAMMRSRGAVEAVLKDAQPHYGINTGFGSLARQRIGPRDLAALQRNLVRSHAAGIGEPLGDDVVKGMMLILAASLCRGLSGVRPIVAETLAALLNAGVTPIVPSVGSVGASGDLAPLAHVALVLMGEGRASVRGREMTGAAALQQARVKPLELGAKEGLALINGTHLMASQGALLLNDCESLFEAACVGLAMSIDAARATHAFLDPRLYEARAHEGAALAARAVAELLAGSRIAQSHAQNDPRVQDPYSLRAGPTVLGAVLAALGHIAAEIAGELGAVTDNPLVFLSARNERGPAARGGRGAAIVSGANFHGMPLALPLDYLAVALCHLAGIAERRIYLLTGAFDPESHLQPFLTTRPGLRSGLMIAQYTAAACVNEMAGLATPASVANIPTSAGMEDYNSFGPRAAAKARRAVELATGVVAIELLCAAQALETHRPLTSGAGVERAHATVRRHVRKLTEDRSPSPDIQALAAAIRRGEIA